MDSNALSMLKYIMETPAQVRSNIKNAESLTAKMVSLFAARPYKSVWWPVAPAVMRPIAHGIICGNTLELR